MWLSWFQGKIVCQYISHSYKRKKFPLSSDALKVSESQNQTITIALRVRQCQYFWSSKVNLKNSNLAQIFEFWHSTWKKLIQKMIKRFLHLHQQQINRTQFLEKKEIFDQWRHQSVTKLPSSTFLDLFLSPSSSFDSSFTSSSSEPLLIELGGIYRLMLSQVKPKSSRFWQK